MLQVAMISTGEEVLHGDILDSNAAWMAQRFYQQGFSLSYRSTIGDKIETLVSEITHQSQQADVIIVNGGLGPTSDDVSSEAAAKVLNVPLVLSEYWLERMQDRFLTLGKTMPRSNIKQAMLPQGAEFIDNPVGTACGFSIVHNEALIIFTPGVPSEFKVMVEQQILPLLKQRYPEVEASECSRLYTFGLSESGIQDQLQTLTLPTDFEIGYRSFLPFIEVKLFGRAHHDERLPLLNKITRLLGDNVVSINQSMLSHVGTLLTQHSLSFSIAEQATHGWLTSWVQEDPQLRVNMKQGVTGSFLQDRTSFPDKTSFLDQTGENQHRITEVFALAKQSREVSNSMIGLASGSVMNDTVAIALSTPDGDWGQLIRLKRELSFHAQRSTIATLMLDMLRRYLEKKPIFGHYEWIDREAERDASLTTN